MSYQAMSPQQWQQVRANRSRCRERDHHQAVCELAAEIQRVCPEATRSEALENARRIVAREAR